MPVDHFPLIEALHKAPLRLVLAATGGGSGAIAELLQTPGASRTVLEAVVPYSAAALSDWLSARPEHYCHERTARAMAMAAFLRAMSLAAREEATHSAGQGAASIYGDNLVGIGCTASLASDRPKRGPHRLHVAAQTAAATRVHSLELTKNARSRREEEGIATALVLNVAAEAAGLEQRIELPLLAGEHLESDPMEAPEEWRDLLLGRTAAVRYQSASALAATAAAGHSPRAVFPGAFDPLHDGHRRMAEVAAELLGAEVAFEISIANVDKPPLDYLEMSRRGRQFEGHVLWYTRAATFCEKSRLFPSSTFVVGADTVLRLAEAKYYGGEPAACQAAIEEIAARGCHFLVFGRARGEGFQTLDDLPLPPSLAALCRGVSAERFREDVSSTQLRRASEG